MLPTVRRVLQFVLPVVFIAGAVAVVFAMSSLMTQAEEREAVVVPRAVSVVEAEPKTHRAMVLASGTVQASARVDVVPQVAGTITELAASLTPGRRLAKGELLARIDTRDYANAVDQAEAAVKAREVEVALEVERGKQARREAELLGKADPTPLALREPQLAAAEANLLSAQAQLANARLQLSRTRLVAPFDAVVSTESLEIGQYVAPGAPVATLLGTARYRVRLSVPVPAMRWIEPDAEAVVVQPLTDGSTLTVPARVDKLLGDLDAQTRTAGVLVAIDDPLSLAQDGVPILPGAYVDVTVLGREVPDLVQVPRGAVQEGSWVWIADSEDLLARRDLTIAFGDPDHVYASAGLEAGDRVVVSSLSLPVEGLPLEVTEVVAATAPQR